MRRRIHGTGKQINKRDSLYNETTKHNNYIISLFYLTVRKIANNVHERSTQTGGKQDGPQKDCRVGGTSTSGRIHEDVPGIKPESLMGAIKTLAIGE